MAETKSASSSKNKIAAAVIAAFLLGGLAGYSVPPTEQSVKDRFHNLFYMEEARTWRTTQWHGIPALQNPMDVWVIQEIIWDTKPDFIVETGTYLGGGALTWASLLTSVNPEGRVITIDIEDKVKEARERRLFKEKVDFIIGSSTSEEVFAKVKQATEGKRVFVILDSNHEQSHVLKELQMYGDLLHEGGYMLVQDSNVNGHPANPDFGPGPHEAIEAFFKQGGKARGGAVFEIDKQRERLMFTLHPDGYLKRVE
jgi:cephalosporin hydroxylase